MKVETVTVKVTDERGDSTKLVIPAYTRSSMDMQVQLDGLVADYMEKSRLSGEPVSLGDFAMYALSEAEKDPHTI